MPCASRAARRPLELEGADRQAVADAAVAASEPLGGHEPDGPYAWVGRLGRLHPGDPSVLAPLLLDLRHLAPGDAIVLRAGNLHAYLDGAGVEIMASSDNVLRGGLTPKHVDPAELLEVLDFGDGALVGGANPAPTVRSVGPLEVLDPGFEAFGLVRVRTGGDPVQISPSSPSLLLAVGGQVDVAGPDEGLVIGHGAAAYVVPGEGPITLSGGGADVWWATTRAGLPQT